MNYFPLHIGDYTSDTVGLTILEDGVYFRLLRAYYKAEGPLSPESLFLHCGGRLTVVEKRAVNRIVEFFFPIGEDGLHHNNRADQEIESYRRKTVVNSENGRHGGLAKARNSPERNASENLANQNQNQNQEPIAKEGARPRPQNQSEVLEYFLERHFPDPHAESEKFWNHYEANGWRQGKGTGRPIKNWKACANQWAARHKDFNNLNTTRNGNQTLATKRANYNPQDTIDSLVAAGREIKAGSESGHSGA